MTSAKVPTILVVDEEPDLLEAVVADFKRKKFKVLVAKSTSEAIRVVKSDPVDVILSDIRTSEGGGIRLLETLRAESAEIPPVIFVAAFSDIALPDVYDQGGFGLLTKPCDRNRLHAAVTNALKPPRERWTNSSAGNSVFERESLAEVSAVVSQPGPARRSEFSLGQGGFFLARDQELPPVSQPIQFSLEFQRHSFPPFSGQGTVRWNRPRSDETLKAGIGVEIDWLEDNAREAALEYLRTSNEPAFIPKF